MSTPSDRTAIRTAAAPAALGPYSQGVVHDRLLWCAGQLGLDPLRGVLVEGGAPAEAEQALRNLDAVCCAAGTSLHRAVRCTVYFADLADFAAVNAVYERFFAAPFPARAAVQVAALPKGGRIEIDAVVAM